MQKWDFLAVYREPLHTLARGSVAGLNPRSWAPNLVTDPIKIKRQQGPTLNQYIGGCFAEYAYSGLQGFLSHDNARQVFLDALDQVNEPHMGLELLSGTYERYYLAATAAGWVVSRKFGDTEVTRECARFLEDHEYLLNMHASPVGVGTPGARMTLGSHLPDRQWTYHMLNTGRKPREIARKPDRWWEHHFNCGIWALREAGRDFVSGERKEQPQTAWPIFKYLNDAHEWLSFIPALRSYDPCYATSYVGGFLHELRGGWPRKAEYPRKNRAKFQITGSLLWALAPEPGWNTCIPIPAGINLPENLF